MLTIFALHFLGGSSRSWQPLAEALAQRARWVPIDLPGFGEAGDDLRYDVAGMAAAVVERIRAEAPGPFALTGHSMGAKVACAVARAVEDGTAGLGSLTRLILLAGSPPSPEPMEKAKRAEMLSWFDDTAAGRSERQASDFVSANVAAPLHPGRHGLAVKDVLRAKRDAWTAWLSAGSLEDWAARIGVLATPTLVVAGAADRALGAEVQAREMMPHFAHARLLVLPNAAHLLPLERPDELAAEIARFLEDGPGEPAISPEAAALIGSARVSDRTREVLLARARPVEPPSPDHLPAALFAVLRAAADRIVPQAGESRIDLAARMAAALLGGPGDGWRFKELPADPASLRAGLATLEAEAEAAHGRGFVALGAEAQDAVLHAFAEGRLAAAAGLGPDRLDGNQARLWFQDLCAAAVQAWVAHPATQARIGYYGFANRGDGEGPAGFVALGPGERDAWEPALQGDA